MSQVTSKLRVLAVCLLAFGGLGFAAMLPGKASAHPLAPNLLRLDIQTDGSVIVTWKVSRRRPMGLDFQPIFPEHCTRIGEEQILDDTSAQTRRWRLDCGEEGLTGYPVSMTHIDDQRASALVTISDPSGSSATHLLTPRDPTAEVVARVDKADVAADYLGFGVEHLLTGWDHVLLVIALMFIAQTRRALIWTITAFTLGHSVTLALATFDLIQLPPAPTEAAIAASIAFVAAEIPQKGDSSTTLLARFPWIMGVAFGLLHGLGFAGALRETGLPTQELPLALVSFNLGIEIGQILVVVVAWWLIRKVIRTYPRGPGIVAYAIGTLAIFWMLQRTALALGYGLA
jgi:hydrogenase/urease accessory protein HupE